MTYCLVDFIFKWLCFTALVEEWCCPGQ